VDQKVTINRRLVGYLTLAFLAGALVAFTQDGDSVNFWQGICTRVGVVLGALWLALPKDGTLGKWAEVSMAKLLVIVLALIVVVRAPQRYAPILLAVVAAGRYLRPPEKPRPPREF
jgi:NhaP-type Na+/H+ or K+/H+ antiporter